MRVSRAASIAALPIWISLSSNTVTGFCPAGQSLSRIVARRTIGSARASWCIQVNKAAPVAATINNRRESRRIAAALSTPVRPGQEALAEQRRTLHVIVAMRAFADLLDALIYTRSRNAKLKLIGDYLRAIPDPDRGWAMAALTGDLELPAVKPALLRGLIEERADPVLFRMSRDYVGDTAETIALLWPTPDAGTVVG